MSEYRLEFSKLKDELRTSLNLSLSNRTPENIQRFIDWAKKKGINDDKLQLKSSPLGGLCLFAKKSLNENDLLLEIPYSVMLTVENALNNRRLSKLLCF